MPLLRAFPAQVSHGQHLLRDCLLNAAAHSTVESLASRCSARIRRRARVPAQAKFGGSHIEPMVRSGAEAPLLARDNSIL